MARIAVFIKRRCRICKKRMSLPARLKHHQTCSVKCGHIFRVRVNTGILKLTKKQYIKKSTTSNPIDELRSHQFMRILVDEPDRLL